MDTLDDNITGTSLGKVIAEWEKDCEINRSIPDDEIANIPKLHSKYLKFLAQGRKNARKAESDYKTMKGIRATYYNGSIEKPVLDKYGWTPYLGRVETRAGVDRLLETDPVLLAILEQKFDYEQIADICEKIIKELNNRVYELRSYMDWQRFLRPNG